MIKYYHIPEKRKTVATLNHTELDAINMIRKQIGYSDIVDPDYRYLMPSSFRAVVVCHPDDEYDEKVGEAMAKEKLMKKYYSVLDGLAATFASELHDVVHKMIDCGNENCCCGHCE